MRQIVLSMPPPVIIMIKSMTGYGKAEIQKNFRTASVEIKSVNHRFLEASFRMPYVLNAYEEEMRRKLKEKLFRGKIDIYISYRSENEQSVNIVANKPIIAAYMRQLTEICREYGMEFHPDVETILDLPDAFVKENDEDEEEIKNIVFEAFDAALEKFISARAKEGENLKADIVSHLDKIEDYMRRIDERIPEIEKALRERLREKVSSLVDDVSDTHPIQIDEERLSAEIVYYVERACIAEETVRLSSHIKAMRAELEAAANIGKKMDFIVQEMNREINTIASKSSDFDIASIVVSVKSEIEKIREQIQNVE